MNTTKTNPGKKNTNPAPVMYVDITLSLQKAFARYGMDFDKEITSIKATGFAGAWRDSTSMTLWLDTSF